MKKFILILLSVVAFTACDEIRMKERADLKDEINNLRYEKNNLSKSVENLRETRSRANVDCLISRVSK